MELPIFQGTISLPYFCHLQYPPAMGTSSTAAAAAAVSSSSSNSACWLLMWCMVTALLCPSVTSDSTAHGFLLSSRRLGDLQNVMKVRGRLAQKLAQTSTSAAEFTPFAQIIKKADIYGVLNSFGGSGARNCYFSPVSCMLLHDVPKYKKQIEGTTTLLSI